MPRNLTYPRSERSAHTVCAADVFERQRVQDWVRANPARTRRMIKLSNILSVVGVVLMFAAIGGMLAHGGRVWP
jgi:hypothetical protein